MDRELEVFISASHQFLPVLSPTINKNSEKTMPDETQKLVLTPENLLQSKNEEARKLYSNRLIVVSPETGDTANGVFSELLEANKEAAEKGRKPSFEICGDPPGNAKLLDRSLDRNKVLQVDRQLLKKYSKAVERFLPDLVVKGFSKQVELEYKLLVSMNRGKDGRWCCKVTYRDLKLIFDKHENKKGETKLNTRKIKGSIEADFHPTLDGFRFLRAKASDPLLSLAMFSDDCRVEVNKEVELEQQPEIAVSAPMRVHELQNFSHPDLKPEKIDKVQRMNEFARRNWKLVGVDLQFTEQEQLDAVRKEIKSNKSNIQKIEGAIDKFINERISVNYKKQLFAKLGEEYKNYIKKWIWKNVSTTATGAPLSFISGLLAEQGNLSERRSGVFTIDFNEHDGLFIDCVSWVRLLITRLGDSVDVRHNIMQLHIRTKPTFDSQYGFSYKGEFIHSLPFADKIGLTSVLNNLGIKRSFSFIEKKISTVYNELAMEMVGERPEEETEEQWRICFEEQYARIAFFKKAEKLLSKLRAEGQEAYENSSSKLCKEDVGFLDGYIGSYVSSKNLASEGAEIACVPACSNLISNSIKEFEADPHRIIVKEDWNAFIKYLTKIKSDFPRFTKILSESSLSISHEKLKKFLEKARNPISVAFYQSIIKRAWSHSLSEYEREFILKEIGRKLEDNQRKARYKGTLERHGENKQKAVEEVIAEKCTGNSSLLLLFSNETYLTKELIATWEKAKRLDACLPKEKGRVRYPAMRDLHTLLKQYYQCLTMENGQRQEIVKGMLRILKSCEGHPEKVSYEVYHKVFPELTVAFNKELEYLEQVAEYRAMEPLFDFGNFGAKNKSNSKEALQEDSETNLSPKEKKEFILKDAIWQRTEREEYESREERFETIDEQARVIQETASLFESAESEVLNTFLAKKGYDTQDKRDALAQRTLAYEAYKAKYGDPENVQLDPIDPVPEAKTPIDYDELVVVFMRVFKEYEATYGKSSENCLAMLKLLFLLKQKASRDVLVNPAVEFVGVEVEPKLAERLRAAWKTFSNKCENSDALNEVSDLLDTVALSDSGQEAYREMSKRTKEVLEEMKTAPLEKEVFEKAQEAIGDLKLFLVGEDSSILKRRCAHATAEIQSCSVKASEKLGVLKKKMWGDLLEKINFLLNKISTQTAHQKDLDEADKEAHKLINEYEYAGESNKAIEEEVKEWFELEVELRVNARPEALLKQAVAGVSEKLEKMKGSLKRFKARASFEGDEEGRKKGVKARFEKMRVLLKNEIDEIDVLLKNPGLPNKLRSKKPKSGIKQELIRHRKAAEISKKKIDLEEKVDARVFVALGEANNFKQFNRAQVNKFERGLLGDFRKFVGEVKLKNREANDVLEPYKEQVKTAAENLESKWKAWQLELAEIKTKKKNVRVRRVKSEVPRASKNPHVLMPGLAKKSPTVKKADVTDDANSEPAQLQNPVQS